MKCIIKNYNETFTQEPILTIQIDPKNQKLIIFGGANVLIYQLEIHTNMG